MLRAFAFRNIFILAHWINVFFLDGAVLGVFDHSSIINHDQATSIIFFYFGLVYSLRSIF